MKKLFWFLLLLVILSLIIFTILKIKQTNDELISDRGNTNISRTATDSKCPDGFIFYENYCQPKILDISWDANLSEALSDSIWIDANENGEVKNFLNNPGFVSDVNNIIGSEKNQEIIAKKIANWIRSSKPYGCDISNLDDPCYDHSPTNNVTTNLSDFEYIYKFPTGVCFDSAVLTVAALRVAGIPSLIHLVEQSHANTLAKINNEWVEIDSTFCSKEQIDSNNCPDASYSKKSAYVIFEIWAPSGDKFCRRDGFCIENKDIPTSNEILIASDSLNSASIISPRLLNLYNLNSIRNIPCIGSFYTLSDELVQIINQDRKDEAREAYISYIIDKDKTKIKNLGVHELMQGSSIGFSNDLPGIGYFKLKIPENVIFVYTCSKGGDNTVLAYKDILPEEGKNYVITADDLIKTDALSDTDFNSLKQKIKDSTEGLGIYPY